MVTYLPLRVGHANNMLVINVLHTSAVGRGYPRPTNNGQDSKQISRSSEDWENRCI